MLDVLKWVVVSIVSFGLIAYFSGFMEFDFDWANFKTFGLSATTVVSGVVFSIMIKKGSAP
ncbi:hypothetical protein [Terribacillus halophilus]|uniref:hypothetical protein n=1 Tax=Terribacillus halophilus TaxID=361279 RepID=UPI000984DD79|nr:hypothetical protein [Terribacillus halophilus]